MIRKWVLFSALALASVFVCGLVAGYTPAIMAEGPDVLQQPIREVLTAAYAVSGTWRLALCLVAMCLIGIAWGVWHKPIGRAVRITDDVYTPGPAGRYQHGSARWLQPSEYSRYFSTTLIDPDDPMIRDLIDHGQDDLRNEVDNA